MPPKMDCKICGIRTTINKHDVCRSCRSKRCSGCRTIFVPVKDRTMCLKCYNSRQKLAMKYAII